VLDETKFDVKPSRMWIASFAIVSLCAGALSLLFAALLASADNVAALIGATMFALMGTTLLRATWAAVQVAKGRPNPGLMSWSMAIVLLATIGTGALVSACNHWWPHQSRFADACLASVIFSSIVWLGHYARRGRRQFARVEAYKLRSRDPLPREIRQLPRSLIGDVSEHHRVKIVGKVRLLDELSAPLSARPCTFYDVRVQDPMGVRIASETRGRDFLIEDDSGCALVRMAAAQVFIRLDARYESVGTQATSRQTAFLQRHGRAPHRRLHYREGTIRSGQSITLVGTAHQEAAPQSGAPYRELPFQPIFFAGDNHTLLITDD
jgi:hypothetical protein